MEFLFRPWQSEHDDVRSTNRPKVIVQPQPTGQDLTTNPETLILCDSCHIKLTEDRVEYVLSRNGEDWSFCSEQCYDKYLDENFPESFWE